MQHARVAVARKKEFTYSTFGQITFSYIESKEPLALRFYYNIVNYI